MKYSILSIMYIVLFIILSCYKILINAFTDLELKQLVDAFNNVSIIIDNKFSTLDNKITMLDNKINGLKQLMIESFRNTHFLGRSKVKI